MNPQDLSLSNDYSPIYIANFLLDVIKNVQQPGDFVNDTFNFTSTNQLRDVLQGTVQPPMNYAMELKSRAVDYYFNRGDLLNNIIIPQKNIIFLDFLKLMYSIGEIIENAQQSQQFNPALQPVVHIIDDESDDEDDVQFMASAPSPKKSKPIEIIDIDNWKGVESLKGVNCGICGKPLTNKESKIRLIPCGHFIHDTPNDSAFIGKTMKCPVCTDEVKGFQNVGVNPDPKDYLGGKQKRKYKRKSTKKYKRKSTKKYKRKSTKIHKKKHHNRKTKYKKNKY